MLSDERVIDIACGGGDAQTLAVTECGSVYSWGDGDYGKLGRGGSDGSKEPKLIDKLQVFITSFKYDFLLFSYNGIIFTPTTISLTRTHSLTFLIWINFTDRKLI